MRDSEIGKAVETERTAQGLSRHTLAVRTGLTSGTIWNIERAAEYDPSFDVLGRVLRELGLKLGPVEKVA